MQVIKKTNYCDLNIKNNDILKDLYHFLRLKTSEVKRENGENVMIHFEKTSDIYMKVSEKPCFEGIIASLLHDAIEDGYLTFDEIKDKFGIKVAIIVQVITKEKEFNYLTENKKKIVINSKILNENNKLSKKTRKNNNEGKLNESEKEAFNLMNIAKEKRNKDYFGHISSLEAMVEYIGVLAKNNGENLSDIELEELAQTALNIKYSDRIHNLTTQWDPENIGKVRRKVKETIKYFLNQSKEINHNAYMQMEKCVYILESNLDKHSKKD